MTDPLLFTWEELSLGPQGLKAPSSHVGSTEAVDCSAHKQQVQLPLLRLVDGLSIQPSDVQSCRLPQVSNLQTEPCTMTPVPLYRVFFAMHLYDRRNRPRCMGLLKLLVIVCPVSRNAMFCVALSCVAFL